MKQQVVFIHGGDAFTKHEDFLEHLRTTSVRNLPPVEGEVALGHWTMTLREDLGSEVEVFMPAMPNKQNAQYEEWKIWFERHFAYLRDGVVLVGWSLGGMFLAKYLSENPFPYQIAALHLLAAPCGAQADETGNDCGTFTFPLENLAALAKKDLKITIWHSKDDFVVPYEQALLYQTHLKEVEMRTFEDRNHFLTPNFPELLVVLPHSRS